VLDTDRPEAPPAARGPRRWGLPPAFRSLRHRNYRLLWIGSLVSSSGDWMDQVALNWLVYQLTGSAVALGVLNLCRLAPILVFTLIGGVVADRFERRRLMFSTQAVSMLLALALAVLVSTGLVQFWQVLIIAAGRGVMLSFNYPARQSLISELVPPQDLMNAIALNSATLNLARVLGPAIGGVLIASVGVAGAFYVNSASFVAVLWGLALMRFGPPPERTHHSMLAELRGGVGYLRGQPALRTLIILALVPMVFGMPYMTLLTVFASDVLRVGATGLGLLTACASIGAVAGALSVAAVQEAPRRGRVMLIGLVAFGLALVGFALSSWLWVSVVMLMAVGVSQQIYLATNNTLIQVYSAAEYRGRVLSMMFLNRSLVPLGTLLAGFGIAAFGAQATTGAMAAVLVLLALAVARFAPEAIALE
jgi:MFS transporter, DHA1 family, staphyloferrin A biosynthesis exporter